MADPLPPVDTSVALPPSVRRAAEAANALHAASYQQPAPEPDPAPAATEAAVAQPEPPAAPPEPAPAPQPEPPPPAPDRLSTAEERAAAEPGSWEQRYYGMEGRWKQAQVSLGQMQQQLSELGDELTRTQQIVQQQPRQQPQPPPQTFVTDQDVQTYGPELLDMIQRAARQAVSPDLQAVTQQTRHVSQQIAKQGTAGLYQQLDQHVPTWKEVNTDPRFRQWCRLPDVYSGQVRGKLLNAAFQAADAPRVVAFFQGFLNEEVATGNAPAPQAQAAAPAAPRQAAVDLATLAAPGRAKPATGNTTASSADKPSFTIAQIKAFYSKPVRDSYIGREADRLRDEQEIFRAQKEGRVR